MFQGFHEYFCDRKINVINDDMLEQLKENVFVTWELKWEMIH